MSDRIVIDPSGDPLPKWQTVSYETHDGIRVLDGPFGGLVFSYGSISLREDPTDGAAYLTFDWDIDRDLSEAYDTSQPAVHQLVGDILTEILTQAIPMTKNQEKDA